MSRKKFIKKGIIFGGNIILTLFITVALGAVFLFIGVQGLNYIIKKSPKTEWEELYQGRTEIGPTSSPSFTPFLKSSVYLENEVGAPASVRDEDIEIGFTSQAPYGVWDEIHKETCEEAVTVMVYAWLNGISMTSDFAEKEILKLVQWQKKNFGFFEDTKAEMTAKVAEKVYGIKSEIIYNPTIEQIKKEIDKGNSVAIGMAGKKLNNPYFKPPGPVYHMLLFRGYNSEGFFVNDPGTRRGEGFFYTFENIQEAAHDWSGSEETLLNSPPVAIVFSK